jgi:hypothetical protein
MMDISGFRSLSMGNWTKKQWKGAVLKANGKSIDDIKRFFDEALGLYLNYKDKVA